MRLDGGTATCLPTSQQLLPQVGGRSGQVRMFSRVSPQTLLDAVPRQLPVQQLAMDAEALRRFGAIALRLGERVLDKQPFEASGQVSFQP